MIERLEREATIMTTFRVEELPDIDQGHIRRGRCPWCLVKTYDGTLTGECDGDKCPECGDEFIGVFTIEDED